MNWFHINYILKAYKYDRFTNKLVVVLVSVFRKSSHVRLVTMGISFWNEPIVTTIKKHEPFNGGVS